MSSLSYLLVAYSLCGYFMPLCLPSAHVPSFIYLHHVFVICHQERESTTVAGAALRASIKLQRRPCLRRPPCLCDVYADTGGMCPAELAGSLACEAQFKRAKATVSFLAYDIPAHYRLCDA